MRHTLPSICVDVCRAVLLIVLLSCAVVSCSGGARLDPGAATVDEETSIELELALAELDGLARPFGADRQVFAALKEELRAALLGGAARRAAAAPNSPLSRVTDLRMWDNGDSGATCRWTYRNQGNYNQDSQVTVSDLTPVGQHYDKGEDAPDWVLARQADGSDDGLVTVSDITPIGQFFNAAVDSYALEVNTLPSPTSGWTEVARVPFADGLIALPGGPRQFVVDLADPVIGRFYRVVPLFEETFGYTPGIAGEPVEYTGAEQPVFSVGGTCFAESGQPLGDTELTLSEVGTEVSATDGTFSFHGVPDGYVGLLTPAFAGLAFEPPQRPVLIVAQDALGQDFAAVGLPVYEITIDSAELASLNADVWSNEYRPADILVDGVLHEGVGVRYRGGSARTFPKQSWKVSFNDDDQHEDEQWGYKLGKLNLNAEYCDPTLMREKLSYDLFQDLGVLSPRARFVKLYVNGDYYGLFTDVENPRRGWLDEFGIDNGGSLYQAQGSRMVVLDSPEEYESVFEKELREDEPFDDLIELITVLNSWQSAEIHEQFNSWLDMQQFKRYMVAHCLISSADHVETNYYLYHDLEDGGDWIIIPWDHDRTWGHHWDDELGFFSLEIITDTPVDYGAFNSSWGTGGWGNVMYDRFMNDSQYRAAYEQQLAEALDAEFSEAAQLGRIDSYYALIHEAVMQDTHKWGENTDFDTRIDELKGYVSGRHEFLRGELGL